MKHNLKSFLILLVAMLSGLTSYAQIEIVDLELDKMYTGKAFQDAFFRFSAPETGSLLLVGNAGAMKFTDATFEQIAPDNECSWLGGFGDQTTYEVPVVKGEIYYIGVKNKMDNWSFTASMNQNTSVELVSTTPSNDKPYTLTYMSGLMVFTFNTAIKVETATASTGATTVTLHRWDCFSTEVRIELKETIKGWLDNGVIKKGDKFTITLTGVKSTLDESVLCNGDGVVSVEFICAGMPVQLAEESYPESFLSFFSLSKEDGIIKLSYDGELSTSEIPSATLGYGNAEAEGEYYMEYLPVSVEGKVITIDLRGKRRIPSEMTVSGTDYESMKISVNNILDINGDFVYAEGQGNFGSWQKILPYEVIAHDLTTEFVPASGAQLAGVNSVELWLSNPDAVTFSGVNIDYKDANGERKSVQYTNEQCNYNNAGADGITLNIPITTEMQTGSNVKVTLTDLESSDGTNRVIEAVYNPKEEFVPVSVKPDNQSQVNSLSEITIAFKDGVVVTIAEGAVATIYSGNGRTELATAPICTTAEPNVIKVTFDEITEPDVYRLVIPENVLTNAEGERNEMLTYSFQVVAPVVYGYVFDPADGSNVESLSKIVVSNVEGLAISWNYDAYLLDDAGNTVAVASKRNGYSAIDENTVEFKLQDPITGEYVTITEAGKYTFKLAQGFFNIGTGFDTTDSDEIIATYTIGAQDGVNSILGDNVEVYNVYNLQGVLIISSPDKAEIDALPTGLYIINGKKVYICK